MTKKFLMLLFFISIFSLSLSENIKNFYINEKIYTLTNKEENYIEIYSNTKFREDSLIIDKKIDLSNFGDLKKTGITVKEYSENSTILKIRKTVV